MPEDDDDRGGIVEGVALIAAPSGGRARERMREHLDLLAAEIRKIDGLSSDASPRVWVGLGAVRAGLIQTYRLTPPQVAVSKMGLVLGKDGALMLPNGVELGLSVGEMYGDDLAEVRLRRRAGRMHPEAYAIVEGVVEGLTARWAVDYDGPSAAYDILMGSEQSAAAMEVGVEMAMEGASPEMIGWVIAAAGAEDAAA